MENNRCCLKNGFKCFNCVFGVSGIFFIWMFYKTGAEKVMDKLDAPRMTMLWVFAISLVVICIFGTCVTWTKSKCCLKAFAVVNSIGIVVMIISGINVAVFKNKLQCCGWTGVEDLGSDIPDSCNCKPSSEQCKPRPQGSSRTSDVFSKSCGKIFGDNAEHLANIILGIYFGFAIAAMMYLIIAIKMIMQISRHENVGEPDIEMTDY